MGLRKRVGILVTAFLLVGCGGTSAGDAEQALVDQHPHTSLSDVQCDGAGDGGLFRCTATVNGRPKIFTLEETDSGELVQLP